MDGVPAQANTAESAYTWWQRGIVYHIYPRSWQDSNGDGVGDLPGITRRLDYLMALGVDAIWLSPIYPSPMADFGYDVSDYTAIHPLFGSLADFDKLLAETHARGMKLLLDWVPNHTSDRHPWFLDAQARGPASPFFRFYVRDEAGAPLHYFDWMHLPNLDYAFDGVRHAMSDASLSWLRRFDVDGFRMDAAWGVRERTPQAWAPWVRARL